MIDPSICTLVILTYLHSIGPSHLFLSFLEIIDFIHFLIVVVVVGVMAVRNLFLWLGEILSKRWEGKIKQICPISPCL